MPADFDKAVRDGGKVRTVSGPNKQFGLAAGYYLHVVFHKGKMLRGEVKKKHPAVAVMERYHGRSSS